MGGESRVIGDELDEDALPRCVGCRTSTGADWYLSWDRTSPLCTPCLLTFLGERVRGGE